MKSRIAATYGPKNFDATEINVRAEKVCHRLPLDFGAGRKKESIAKSVQSDDSALLYLTK
jgi:hypothetical protein